MTGRLADRPTPNFDAVVGAHEARHHGHGAEGTESINDPPSERTVHDPIGLGADRRRDSSRRVARPPGRHRRDRRGRGIGLEFPGLFR